MLPVANIERLPPCPLRLRVEVSQPSTADRRPQQLGDRTECTLFFLAQRVIDTRRDREAHEPGVMIEVVDEARERVRGHYLNGSEEAGHVRENPGEHRDDRRPVESPRVPATS